MMAMAYVETNDDMKRFVRRAGLVVVTLFWSIQFLELSLTSFSQEGVKAWATLAPRTIVLVVGFLFTLAVIEAAARTVGRALPLRLAATAGTALVTCLLLVVVNWEVFLRAFPAENAQMAAGEYMFTAFSWSWFFFTITGAIVALSYGLEVRDRERRLTAMEAVTKEAQLAALRYQLNPHFLFNTLNSIASLIDSRDNAAAERMVENLADFLRATLELDPLIDIPMWREIELQALYLSVEKTRFPDRLRTVYDLPSDLAGMLVPALITQPLVENAIRHAVARSTAPVTIGIRVTTADGLLKILVEDDGCPAPGSARAGTGVGLNNVRARLEGRFGSDHAMVTGPLDRGYRATIEFPLRSAA